MATLKNAVQPEHEFEMPQEVIEQMNSSDGTVRMITEEDVSDLNYVDISGNPYRWWKRFFDIVLSAVGLLVLLIPIYR